MVFHSCIHRHLQCILVVIIVYYNAITNITAFQSSAIASRRYHSHSNNVAISKETITRFNEPSKEILQRRSTHSRTSPLSMLPKLPELINMFLDSSKLSNGINSNSATIDRLNGGSNTVMNGMLPMAFLSKSISPVLIGFAGTTTAVASAAAATGSSLLLKEDTVTVEAQLLNDMSHIGIDLAGLFIPSVLIIRIASIIGRICTISADYIPDHTIVPEEMIFQIIMLSAALIGLMKAALIPAAASMFNTTSPSVKDGRAYTLLFQPAGTSWLQYKALSVCGAIDWITLFAGETITSFNYKDATSQDENTDDYMYWLYSGDIRLESSDGDFLYTMSGGKKSSSVPVYHHASRGLFGEHRLLQVLRNISPNKVHRSKDKMKDTTTNTVSVNDNVAVVTSDTAKILRVHIPRLQLLMEHDTSLVESMRTLVFHSMEAKLQAQVQETTNLLKSFNLTTSPSY